MAQQAEQVLRTGLPGAGRWKVQGARGQQGRGPMGERPFPRLAYSTHPRDWQVQGLAGQQAGEAEAHRPAQGARSRGGLILAETDQPGKASAAVARPAQPPRYLQLRKRAVESQVEVHHTPQSR